MRFIAHIEPKSGREQALLEHLEGTAERAAGFAEPFGARELAYRCGMLHDIGKYSEKFQKRIRGLNEKVDHSTAGALTAKEQGDVPGAFCIAGHHGGLPDGGSKMADTSEDATFCGKMKRRPKIEIEDYSAYTQEITIPPAQPPKPLTRDMRSAFFFIHMLYSCLVDADWLDTETFMSGPRTSTGEPLNVLLEKLNDHIAPWWNTEKELNQRRCTILRALLDSGGEARGMFSLTVPTGGGKTVSSVAFALRHALANHMRRIIYVIPYTSIIEQTQAVFEGIFGAENVVAHYANVDFDADENASERNTRRLAAENWDAPIILTTAVQFFESLFSNKPSRCRKLHNIAGSVIIFDEAQMLPVTYLKPCVWAISRLVEQYGCSAVLCTATQPALDRLLKEYLPDVPVRELCPDVSGMYEFFRRVRYERAGKLTDDALAERLNSENQVLCIVSTRRQAQAIFNWLSPEGSFHLSTAMTPEHRRCTLDEVRRRLKADEPCRVVSTSLVEAGVDVDFPVVWRALAGLDSMIQAGGRCNRENKRLPYESVVYLFETEARAPEMIRQNIAAAERVMRDFDDISSPEAIDAYFEFLYYTLKDEGELDKKRIIKDIDSGALSFASIAERFKLIENEEYAVYVPLGDGEKLVQELRESGPSRVLMRKLGQHAIGVYPAHFAKLLGAGAVERVSENAAILLDTKLYDKKTGIALHIREGQELFV